MKRALVVVKNSEARSFGRRASTRWAARALVIAGAVLVTSIVAPPAADAATACTPTAGWAECTQFDYTGADQVFTVPAGVTSVRVTVWGAAGAPGGTGALGAGMSEGVIPVSPGDQLTVTVGQGGSRNSTAATYGGGGAGGLGERDASPGVPSWTIGGSGGGMSAIWGGAYGTDPLVIAGGSGASAPTRGSTPGGSGGGATGGSTTDATGASGSGGSGVGGAPGNNGICVAAATAGAQFVGGTGAPGFDGGSGGGGGYFGGGGGSCQQNEGDDNNEGAGGGGSGYVNTARVFGALTTGATSTAAAGSGDDHYVAGIGYSDPALNVGGNGMVVIQSEAPAPTPSPVTSSGALGASQQVTVTPPTGGNVYLRNALDVAVTSVTTAAGTFTVVPATGVITFTPAAGFVGTAAPVTFVVIDATDRQGESTYTVTVLAGVTAAPAERLASGGAELGALGALALAVLAAGAACVAVRRRYGPSAWPTGLGPEVVRPMR